MLRDLKPSLTQPIADAGGVAVTLSERADDGMRTCTCRFRIEEQSFG